LVCGVAPFIGDSPVSVAYKHVREEAIPPSHHNPDVPPALEQIIMSALAKDPDHRYQSADDLRADLLRFRRGRPIAAAPVTALVAEVPSAAVANAGTAAYAATATVASPRVPVEPPTPYGQPPRRRRHPATFTLLTLLILAALLGGILFATSKLGPNQVKISVPNVKGKTVDAAVKEITAQHLLFVTRNVPSDKPIDTVVDQSPKGGADVKKGATVTLSVSAGKEVVDIPDVSGQTVNDAIAFLKAAKFKVKRDVAQFSSTVDPGSIISTIPPFPGSAPAGSTIHIIPSKGVNIPNVVNLSQQVATNLLVQAGLLPDINNEASNDIAPGNVTRTNPPYGTNNVAGGSSIKMFVSTGAEQVTVPNVIGRTTASAEAYLRSKNLQPSVVYQQTSQKGNHGRVLDQSPEGGNLVDPQSPVVLTVGAFTAPTTVPTVPVTTATTTPTSGP
jgi:serine/threonine-protein kinase